MDETAEVSALPLDFDGSLDCRHLPEVTFGSFANVRDMDYGSPSHRVGKSASERLSPVRGRNLKEYDQQISDLKKENFNLKIRIYYMDERMQQRYGDGQDVFKTNIELQVEVDKLKRDLVDKQALIQKASDAMATMEANRIQAEENMKSQVLSEFKEEIDDLQTRLTSADQECEESRQQAREAGKQVDLLQAQLKKITSDSKDFREENNNLSQKLKDAESDAQQLTAQLRLAEQATARIEKEKRILGQRLKDMDNKLHDSKKDLDRKDRDLQDELEDALQTIKRKDEQINTLDSQVKEKESMVDNLEGTLHEVERKAKDCETQKNNLEAELKKLKSFLNQYKKSLEGSISSVTRLDEELGDKKAELNEANKLIKTLQDNLYQAQLDKSKMVGNLTKDLTDLETDNARLRRQLAEAEKTSEDLVMTLGRKKGELAGFQDQLQTAMDALEKSEAAVEALQKQLETERAEFEERLKGQGVKDQTDLHKQNRLDNNNDDIHRQLLDLQKDSELSKLRHSQELASLQQELETLRYELQNKNLKQTPEGQGGFYESHTHETVNHHYIDRVLQGHVNMSTNLKDLKLVLEELKDEMSCLSDIQDLLGAMRKTGESASSADLLLTEISSVQRIYRQLEGGVEKNSQIHQALLKSLNGEQRQSDSPDSNSCQDGGFNLAPSVQQTDRLDRATPGGTDQWPQTTTASSRTVGTGLSPHGTLAARSDQLGEYDETNPGHVRFSADNPRLASLTDDDKGNRVQVAYSPSGLDDYCGFKHENLFDINDFDVRAHDRASSVKPQSRRTSLLHNRSESAAVPSSQAASAPTSSACNSVTDSAQVSPEIVTNSAENAASAVKGGAQSLDNSVTIDFNNHHHNNLSPASQRTSGVDPRSSLADDKRETKDSKISNSQGAGECEGEDHQRSRRSSWADELEQYKVNEQNKSANQKDSTESQHHKVVANMSAVELRDLVAQLQLDLVDAVKEKKALQDKLTASASAMGQTVNGQDSSRLCASNKSRIPVLRASSSHHSTTSEDSDCIDTARSSQVTKRVLFDHGSGNIRTASRTGRGRTLSADPTQTTSLKGKLSQSDALIKHLEDKLHATENTVRLLSKKNKKFVSVLESAGIMTGNLNRSNSESCLTSFTEMPSQRAYSTTSLNTTDASNRLAHLLSPPRGREFGVWEKAREAPPHSMLSSINMLQSSPPSAIVHSPTIPSTTSNSPSRNGEASTSTLFAHQANPKAMSQVYSGTDISVSGSCFKLPASPPSKSLKPATTTNTTTSPGRGNTSNTKEIRTKQGNNTLNQLTPGKMANGSRNTSMLGQSKLDASMLGQSRLDASMLNGSVYPDVTYSSMLDNTLLHRLHNHMVQLDSTLSGTVSEDLSKLTVSQLHGRVEHLERVNLTLREEIGVYEAIQQSQGTQVSPSFCSGTANDNGGGDHSDDELLRQHLEEIRKLRQRLEGLDITKDPEQLLIFQSHTQQRLARQESMLSHLQQQLVEKEDQHLRECAQLQHRLARDKAALAEKLEQTIAELRKHADSQDAELKDKQRQVYELKIQLEQQADTEKTHEKEMKKVLDEKSEVETDLIKREKEFLEMEKMMFRLEMAREGADAECKRMGGEMEEQKSECERLRAEVDQLQQEVSRLRKEADEHKHSSSSLKDIVVKRERSLQEKVHNLQKVTSEKALVEQHASDMENKVKRLEEELENVRHKMQESRTMYDREKQQLESNVEGLKSDLRKRESLEARSAFQKAGYEAELVRLNEEKVQMKVTHEKEVDRERLEARWQIDELRAQVREKQELESEVEALREKVKTISELQYNVDRLHAKLDDKSVVEKDLRDKLATLRDAEAEAKSLQESLDRSEECLRSIEEERVRLMSDLRGKDEKIKKRDTQLKHLINQHFKLETMFKKQKDLLKEKTELLQSQKKQLRLFEVSMTCSSQEEREDVMKQLITELIATRRQVEELLSQLEHNSLRPAAVRLETVSRSGVTATVTTSGAGSSGSSGQDNVDTVLSVGVREGSPEQYLGSLSPGSSHKDLDLNPSSPIGGHTPVATSSCHTSPLRPVSTNPGVCWPNLSLSPRQLKYFNNTESALSALSGGGSIPQGMVGSDIRSLFAVLQLENHEKLRKEAAEGLTTLSSIEARLNDRLRHYKAKSVSESMDYSTLRETSLSCHNLRTCLEEAVRLATSAWITELPPLDSRGHFYDPVLAEQNESLKRELTLLRSRNDLLGHTVKEQQGRLQATNERRKNWEQSLYKQLHKTTGDLEQAKENFDAAGLVPGKNQSLRVRSPNKPAHTTRMDDTV